MVAPAVDSESDSESDSEPAVRQSSLPDLSTLEALHLLQAADMLQFLQVSWWLEVCPCIQTEVVTAPVDRKILSNSTQNA